MHQNFKIEPNEFPGESPKETEKLYVTAAQEEKMKAKRHAKILEIITKYNLDIEKNRRAFPIFAIAKAYLCRENNHTERNSALDMLRAAGCARPL